MEEMKHFCHEDHPLKYIDNSEVIIDVDGDGDDEKKEAISCCVCQEPIASASVYGCVTCRYFLHIGCIQLTVNLHFHSRHPLLLSEFDLDQRWFCDVCRIVGQSGGFAYFCEQCKFHVCMNCVVIASAHKAAAAAIKKEATIKLKHEGHPQHALTLELRQGAFLCDACNTDDKDLFYRCNSCDFWIHKTCASLDTTIDLPRHDKHPLLLVYSLPEIFYKFSYYCGFCKKLILDSDWMYHCANCRYFAHIKCALSAYQQPSTLSDGPSTSNAEEEESNNDLLHFPMAEAFTDPLKLLHFKKISIDDDDTIEINHWSHTHPLILHVEPQGNNMPGIIGSNYPIKVCYGCVRPLSLPYYSCKDGCSFTLHKYCANLPRTLEHQLHPKHLLNLVDFENSKFMSYRCSGCFIYGNTFVYKCETCKFYLDVNCAFLPNIIKHDYDKHPLVQIIDFKPNCNACGKYSSNISYACKTCDFHLDQLCALKSPHSIAHRHCKGHPVPLTYPPIEDHPEDFYCDICEEEMHPKLWLYYCHKCDSTFHLDCIARVDPSANFYMVGTIIVKYHKHPLTYVRKRKTPRYVCLGCNRDINGHLILECQTGTCPFRVCRECHLKKR